MEHPMLIIAVFLAMMIVVVIYLVFEATISKATALYFDTHYENKGDTKLLNEWDNFTVQKKLLYIETCPHCRNPLTVWVHKTAVDIEFLVCEPCKYAKDVSR